MEFHLGFITRIQAVKRVQLPKYGHYRVTESIKDLMRKTY